MAPPTPVNSTVEQLVRSLLPKNSTAPKLRRCKDAFSRRLKHHNFGRTNQFEVIERLDGLEEKLQVLNRDDLSDALHQRRNELRHHEQRFLPDVLDLLLRLSVDPANLIRSDGLEHLEPRPKALPLLRWADVEESDPIDYSDPIWQPQDYSDFSSDDDAYPISSEAASPSSVREDVSRISLGHRPASSFFESEVEIMESSESVSIASFGGRCDDGSILITESQAIREALMMLQGLPTRLYANENTREPEQRFTLRNINGKLFQNVLRAFSQIARQVDYVRVWLKAGQNTQYMRTLHQMVESQVMVFDAAISDMQETMLNPKISINVGISLSLETARSKSTSVTVISRYLQAATSSGINTVAYLDILFNSICAKQAAGEMGPANTLLELFRPVLEMYLKPVEHWMGYGEIDPNLEPIFISSSERQKDLSTLWHAWYNLDQQHGENQAPQFLRPYLSDIFAVGKTSLFLRHLGQPQNSVNSVFRGLLDESKRSSLSSCLPFSETLAASIETRVRLFLDQASALLYQELDQQCALLAVLNVLGCIYFGKRGPITDSIDNTLFRRIDKCNASWCDRFLVCEILQNAFSDVPELEVSRLAVHASHTSRSMQNRRKSVKVLGDISIEYILPWQSSNIVPQSSLVSYRRVALFLMQIRRARYSLERRAHFHVMNPKIGADPMETAVSRALYRRLLLFVNTLYGHLTGLVIEESTTSMRTRMQEARRVDEMAAIHSDCTTKLEKACITSKKLKPIRDTIVSILDLCIRFSDILKSPAGSNASDTDTMSYRSAASHPQKRLGRNGLGLEVDDGDDEDADESSDEEGYSTFVILEEPSMAEEFKKMNAQLTRHLDFVIAGLQSLGRVEEGSSWAILASSLS